MRSIIDWWDHFIYRLAYKNLSRRLRNNPGEAYLFELTLREWRENEPLSVPLKKATEAFHEAMRDKSRQDFPKQVKK